MSPKTVTEPERARRAMARNTYVGNEANLPTWWMVSLLVGAALLHVQAGVLARRSGARGAAAWWVLGALLALVGPRRTELSA